jgi:CcmD family protein
MTTIARALMMTMIVLMHAGAWSADVVAQQPEQQEEFIPIDQLPPQDQLPAAPLLIGAYAFVLVMLFVYMVSVSRRLTMMQREVERLEADVKRAGRP